MEEVWFPWDGERFHIVSYAILLVFQRECLPA